MHVCTKYFKAEQGKLINKVNIKSQPLDPTSEPVGFVSVSNKVTDRNIMGSDNASDPGSGHYKV